MIAAGLLRITFGHRYEFHAFMNVITAAAVITFMNAWNSYLWPKVILNKPAAITMPMLIANLAAGYTVDYGVLMMGVLFCSIPTMLVFFVLQKQFAEGITGSVK